MSEFRKLLSHLNTKTAIPVCLFTILNISYTFAAIIYFIRIYDQFTSNKVVIMAMINIFWWLILGLYPFFQVSLLLHEIHIPEKVMNVTNKSIFFGGGNSGIGINIRL